MTTFCCHPLKSYSSFHLASTIAAKTMCQGNTLHNQYMYLLGDLFREGIGNHYVDSNLNNHFGTGPGAIFQSIC